MVGMSTLAQETSSACKILVLLIDYFEGKCILSQVISRKKPMVGLFLHALKSIEGEEILDGLLSSEREVLPCVVQHSVAECDDCLMAS